jgi:SAM-dependent methyltransferase
MAGAGPGGEGAPQAVLPLIRQNEYRARYRSTHPGWETSGTELEALVRSRITPQSRVLDLGCGRGGVVELVWRQVALGVGLDPDVPSLIEHRAPGMPVVRGVGERLPFTDSAFDLVVCVWVMEHLAAPLTVLREVRRVLRPGGHFLFLTPNLRHPVMLANRLGRAVPRLQRRIVPRLYGRVEADTFPVRYQANTPGAIRTLAAAAGLDVARLRAIPDPTYLAWNEVMFQASLLLESLIPESWAIHLLGDLVRA